MAINFPTTPVNGSTYDYEGIRYTFTNPNVAFEGYWRVTTPGSVGIATSAEISAGVDIVKYITPEGLNGSQYVREDEASGETRLNYSGSERLKTDSAGVEVTGNFVLPGTLFNKGSELVDFIVESGEANGGRYRKWHSGLVEQWRKWNASGSTLTISLPVPYNTAKGFAGRATQPLVTTSGTGGSSGYYSYLHDGYVSATHFRIFQNGNIRGQMYLAGYLDD
tara:strand:- start:677 stop:1342 length:666 start_codon:yes stop_codon:yes gene_type:complete